MRNGQRAVGAKDRETERTREEREKNERRTESERESEGTRERREGKRTALTLTLPPQTAHKTAELNSQFNLHLFL